MNASLGKKYVDDTDVLFEAAYFDFDKLIAETKALIKVFAAILM